jgi:TPR repeat protein
MRIIAFLLLTGIGAALSVNAPPAAAQAAPQVKSAATPQSRAAERRYRSGFARGITRTDQLPSLQLQAIRRRMISHRRVTYSEIQMLADRGDGLAALFVAKRLSNDPDLIADAIHYYTIACSTGRAGAVSPLVGLLGRSPPGMSAARLEQAEKTLRDHAARRNPVAIAGLIKFYSTGLPFGRKPDEAQKLQRDAAKGGDAKVALDLAISMISEGLSGESEKAEAMNYLRIAEKSPDLKIKTVAATVGRSLQAAPVTEIEVSQ